MAPPFGSDVAVFVGGKLLVQKIKQEMTNA